MADPAHYVEAPTRSPRKGGIRDVAEVREGLQRLALGGLVQYTSPGCQVAVGEAALCYPAATQEEKDRSGIETLDGLPIFGAYVGIECWLGGSDYEADARRLLDQSEDRAIEQALDNYLESTTPAEADSLLDAIASADEDADGTYPGAPVIVMNRHDAVLAKAADAIDFHPDSGKLVTANHTPILASARITRGSVSVVGALTVLASPIQVHRVQHFELNREYAIAERAYALLIDCNYALRYEI